MVTSVEGQDLYQGNSPQDFWCVIPEFGPSDAEWAAAWDAAIRLVELPALRSHAGTAAFLSQVLGEGQFGQKHWDLGLGKRLYYELKPLLPRAASRVLRRIQAGRSQEQSLLHWPIEDRYARLQWEIPRQVLELTGRQSLPFIHFWPHERRFALVLTHDVETADGQAKVLRVADLEESLGFRSSFNFVPERYRLDWDLIRGLKRRGFEIGVHGLRHDGKLFRSEVEFRRRAQQINRHLKEWGSVGFRAPLTHRNPAWMQVLDIEYDLSFFDTDPYEPLPGGTMSIWPFIMGRFVELPYTLVQDYTLTAILGETTARPWLNKLEFIKRYFGMALLNSHPDYLESRPAWDIYVEFLERVKGMGDYWNGLPREIAGWWRERASSRHLKFPADAVVSELRVSSDGLEISQSGREWAVKGEGPEHMIGAGQGE
jgi:hypothetical protein